MAVLAISAIGYAIGDYFGSAAIGWAVGSYIGEQMFAPHTTTQGPKLSDLTVQSSANGAAIPRVWGRYRCSGNIIWSTDKIPHTTSHSAGGKGGGGSTYTTTTYSASFAVLLGEQIGGIRRIWADGNLIYDVSSSASVEALVASNQVANGMAIYTGTATQQPDPTIESYLGAGNVPAYRHSAYVVFTDYDLGQSGHVPNFTFEVVGEVNAQASLPIQLVATVLNDTNVYNWQNVYACPLWIAETGIYDNGVIRFQAGDTDYIFGLDGSYIGQGPGHINQTIETGYTGGLYTVGVLGGYRVCKKVSSSPSYSAIVKRIDNVGATGAPVDALIMESGADVTLHNACVTNDGLSLYVFYTDGAGARRIRQFNSSGNQVNDQPTNLAFETSGLQQGVPIVAIDGQYCWYFDSNGTVHLYTLNSDLSVTAINSVYAGQCFTGAAVATGDFLWMFVRNTHQGWFYSFRASQLVTPGSVALSAVVSDLCQEAGLAPTDIDVSDLSTTSITGFSRTGQMSARSAIQPLMQAFWFDACESDDLLRFVRRGAASVATVTEAELSAHEYGSQRPDPLDVTRQQEAELPRRVEVTYIDPAIDYQQNLQRARRVVTDSQLVQQVQLPIVLSAGQAIEIAEVLEYDAWTSRNTSPLALSYQHLALDPTDVIEVALDNGNSYLLRLTQATVGAGMMQLRSAAERAAAYVSTAAGATDSAGSQSVGLSGPTALYLLDIPMLRDQDNDAGFYLAAHGYLSGWTGAVIYRSTDNGSSWSEMATVTTQATAGTATNALAAGPTDIWDRGNSVNVSLLHGDLYSATQAQVFGGANAIAIGAPGRWEIAQFTAAAVESDGTITLSGLLRGRRGTEWAVATHQTGDTVVLLESAALLRISASLDQVGISDIYRAVTVGSTLDSASSRSFADNAVGLECYAPCHLDAHDNGNGTWTVDWGRRGRIAGEWRDYVDVPLGEASEQYQVEVWSGGAQASTTTVTAPSATVTASAGDIVKIAQVSASVGAGHYAEITL